MSESLSLAVEIHKLSPYLLDDEASTGGAGEKESLNMFPEEEPEPKRGTPSSLAGVLSHGPFTVISLNLGIFFWGQTND